MRQAASAVARDLSRSRVRAAEGLGRLSMTIRREGLGTDGCLKGEDAISKISMGVVLDL